MATGTHTAAIAAFPLLPHRTSGELVDELGRLKARIADLEAEADQLKGELVGRGEDWIEGTLFKAAIVRSTSWRLDRARLEAAFGDLTPFSKLVHSTAVRVTGR